MKALIVDDEKHVREAIKLLVDWKSYGIDDIYEARDGIEATELIGRLQPELVFTDMMMPGMDGSTLLSWVAGHHPGSKTIVISGHDDFQLVRGAVKSGSVDYILKPIDPEQLNGAIAKAIEAWRAEERERAMSRAVHIELNQLKPVYLEQYFSSVLSEPGAQGGWPPAVLRELRLAAPVPLVRAAVASLSLSAPGIREKFPGDQELMFFALTNICNEILLEREAGYAFRYWGKEQELVLLFWGECAGAPSLIGDIREAIMLAMKASFDFGLGQPAAFPSDALTSYRQARLALLRRNVLSRSSDHVVSFDDTGSKRGATLLSFHDHEEQLRFAVQSGNSDQLQRALDAWFAVIEESGYLSFEGLLDWREHFERTKAIWLGESDGGDTVLASKPATSEEKLLHGKEDEAKSRDNGLSTTRPLPLHPSGGFHYEAWKEAVTEEMETISKLLSSADKEKGIIHDIALFLEQHAHEDITLQDVASRFFLSREYISRKFKQEMNENVSDYIAGIRMKRAKELLGNASLRISQIAEQVGFQDEKYFSKVFKKWTGCTPGDYRKQHYGGR
ncbi:DNA-binding response regulator [Paenibacillus agaridevorans]|uniref:DNA-binding response regulator n=1 Tax=Paenibacillus agaridevorans TaxID=171404 RepID=A0A2R5F4T5_9BACL|nr:helix-turn-helix domain-containing protein [Paenibacillus agaridevorans]GBG11164.1 DNA-binding response regulator [Paenibacillus agaridevorans]